MSKALTTYKSLYQQVLEEIENKVSYTKILSDSKKAITSNLVPHFDDSNIKRTEDETNAYVRELLSHTLRSKILYGLCVKAHNPVNDKVIVYAGKGISYGAEVEVTTTELEIPFDGVTQIFYIVLWADRLVVQMWDDPERLTIAKIIVPNPRYTLTVIDNREDDPNSWNAYIMMRKEYGLYGNCEGVFEEDTLDLLRENISEVLSDNLIGNIRLSENLKIINTSGTMEVNSSEMKFYDTEENLSSKFDNTGTYFYNPSGVEIAKFTTDGARVGNICVDVDAVRSADFIEGEQGFEITDTGYAEFEDAYIRGRIRASVFEYDKISTVGGKIIVTNSTVVEVEVSPTDTIITLDTVVFDIGDVLHMKDGIDSEYMLVTGVNGNDITVIRDYGNSYTSGEDLPIWGAGTAILSTGNSTSGCHKGYLVIDAQTQYAPFIDVIARDGMEWDDVSVKVRLGNLEGITDPLYGNLEGYGLYANNAYLTGCFIAPDIKTNITGSRIELNECGLRAYNNCNNNIFTVITEGVDEGDVIIGDNPLIGGNEGLIWDSSTGCLCIAGYDVVVGDTLSADNINGGTLNLSDDITISAGGFESGDTFPYLTMDNTGISSYNCDEHLTFCLYEGHLYNEDVMFQDPDCIDYYSCLSSGNLVFHDECGDTPYLKRIATGCAPNGATVFLRGWKDKPELSVFPIALYTYNGNFKTSTQRFCVYYDNLRYYNYEMESGESGIQETEGTLESGIEQLESGMCSGDVYIGRHYGWMFDVHTMLFNEAGTKPGNYHNASIENGYSFSTSPCVCSTMLRFKFQNYATSLEDTNYCYGSFTYYIVACSASNPSVVISCACYYEQPYGSTMQLTGYNINQVLVQFPYADTWCVSVLKTDTEFDYNCTPLLAKKYTLRIQRCNMSYSLPTCTCCWICCIDGVTANSSQSAEFCVDIDTSFVENWCTPFPPTPILDWHIYCERKYFQVAFGNHPMGAHGIIEGESSSCCCVVLKTTMNYFPDCCDTMCRVYYTYDGGWIRETESADSPYPPFQTETWPVNTYVTPSCENYWTCYSRCDDYLWNCYCWIGECYYGCYEGYYNSNYSPGTGFYYNDSRIDVTYSSYCQCFACCCTCCITNIPYSNLPCIQYCFYSTGITLSTPCVWSCDWVCEYSPGHYCRVLNVIYDGEEWEVAADNYWYASLTTYISNIRHTLCYCKEIRGSIDGTDWCFIPPKTVTNNILHCHDEFFDSFETLDPNGIVGWIAVGYQ